MKARIFSLLLIVALLVSVSVFAAEASNYTVAKTAGELQTLHAECPVCKTAVTWERFRGRNTETDSDGQIKTSKHWYFDNLYDVAEEAPYINTINSGVKICIYFLDVEGGSGYCNPSASQGYAFKVAAGAELNLMGKGTVSGSGSTVEADKYGGAIRLMDGTSAEAPGGKLTILHDVTVQQTTRGGSVYEGGAVFVGEYGSLTMKGGTISGTKVTYVNDSTKSRTGQTSVQNGGAVCLDSYSTMTMTAGTINGASNDGIRGGAIFVAPNAQLTLGEEGLADDTVQILGGSAAFTNGGLIANVGTVNMNDGTLLSGGKSKASTNSSGGGAVYNNGTFTMNGGTIQDGSVTVDKSGESSVGGGNVFSVGGRFVMNDGIIENGKAKFHGGNVMIAGGEFELNEGTVSGGIAGWDFTNNEKTTSTNGFDGGGNIYAYSGTLDINGGDIYGGYAACNGGNIFVRKATTEINDADIYLTGTTDRWASNGANMYIRGVSATGVNVTIDGATEISSKQNTYATIGKNIYVHSGTLNLNGGKTLNAMMGGTGINMQNSAVVAINLDSDAQVDQLYIPGTNPAVKVKGGFEGSVNVRFYDSYFLTLECGSLLTGITVEQNYANTASLCIGTDIDKSDDTKEDRPYIPAVYTNGQLMIAYYSSVDTTGKTMLDSSKATNNVAKEIGIASVADVGTNAYVKVHGTTDAAQTLDDNVTIDMNGKNLTVGGNGTVTMKDSSSDNFTSAAGMLTVNGNGVTVANASEIIDGMIAVKTDSTYKAYPLELKVNSVALRTWANGDNWSGNGIYYGAKLKTHKDLDVTAGGIAVKKDSAVNKSFEGTGYTENAAWKGTGLNTESQAYGVMVSNILDAGTQYIDDEIYAAAYITIGEDQTFWSTGEEPHYSIQSIVNAYNDLQTNSAAMANLKKFYDYWSINGIDFTTGGWTVDNIKNYGVTA